MQENLYKIKVESSGDNRIYYCPNGHSMKPRGQSKDEEIAKLKTQIAELEARPLGRLQV